MTAMWREIWRFTVAVLVRISDGNFGLVAAGVAFYAVFAVFPVLGAVVAIWGLMADPVVIAGYLSVAERFLPPDASLVVHDQVMGLVRAPAATLGWATFVSLLVALYSARNGVSALVSGLDVMHRATPRSFLHGLGRDLVLTLALIGALLAALATVVIVPLLLSWLSYDAAAPMLSRFMPWIAMVVLVMSCLSILFRYGPNVPKEQRPGWFSIGVIFTAFAWAGVSMGFSAYLENFNSYNRIYGSIGAAVILMMWLYLSVSAILVGGAINAELDQRRAVHSQMGRRRQA